MHSIISASLLALAMFTTTSIASQVNRYSDDHCGNFQGAVFSSGFGCQPVSGASVLVAGNKGAQCNYYNDANCNQFAFTLRNPGCSATGNQNGAIACNNNNPRRTALAGKFEGDGFGDGRFDLRGVE